MVNVRSAKAAITYTVKVKLDRHNYRKVAQEGRSLPCGQGGIRVSHTNDFRICSFPLFAFLFLLIKPHKMNRSWENAMLRSETN
jgi:hypothetical protein